jgi:nicotinamidase-related amidase
VTVGPQRDSLRERLDPTHTALVIVDVQNDFCDPAEFPAAASMLPRLRAFVRQARGAGVRLVFTRAVHSETTDSPVWVSRFDDRPHLLNTCRAGTAGADFHQDVLPQEGDLVIEKHRYSAFIGTSLELRLRAMGVRTLVFTGIATNVCVESTARDAFQRDFHVVLANDCTAASSPALQEASEENVRRYFGLVCHSEEIGQVWRSRQL